MIDPVSAAMQALTSRSPAAVGILFLAGVVTSIGPCIAPRYIAIAALANGDRRPLIPTLAFVAGLICAFVTLGFVAGLLGTLWSVSSMVYSLLAGGLIAGGGIALVRAAPGPKADHACSHRHVLPAKTRPLAAIFVLGACSAFVLSPCCTPVVAAVVATSTAIGKPLTGAVLLLSFAVGHAVPLVFFGTIGERVFKLIPRLAMGQAPAIVGAVLMLALGIYYGVLA